MSTPNYLEEAINQFPEAETNSEALDLLESKLTKEVFELTQNFANTISETDTKLRELSLKAISVRVLRKTLPVSVLETKLN